MRKFAILVSFLFVFLLVPTARVLPQANPAGAKQIVAWPNGMADQ
jgi:hypothetical protein